MTSSSSSSAFTASSSSNYSLASGKKSKVINDPVHGHIKLPGYSMEVVDTPQFQRLRDLKQVGTTYFLFPGGSHNRFEHCIGVSYLAGDLMNRFQVQQPELNITERDKRLVTLAGLCHDLGHGPFSHAFEDWAGRHRPGWHHEDMSLKMVEYLVDENALEYDRDDVRMIQALIAGERPLASDNEKAFLFDIVSNSRNSVDVDKFDYLARDCHNLGMKCSYDCSRLMTFSRVINNEICFHHKEVYNIYELFHTRYSLFKQVYTHRVGKAVEYMILDILTLADPFLHLSSCLDNPSDFYSLTDSVLRTIECSKLPELQDAQKLIRDLRKRKLYKFVDEVLVPPELWSDFYDGVTTEDIVSRNSELTNDDVIVHKLQLNYALKDRNPVDNVHFFNPSIPEDSFAIPKSSVSLLIPDEFCEKYVRIYCRDPAKSAIVQKAFRAFVASFGSRLAPHIGFSLPSPTRFDALGRD